jgi:hypothetical protein
MPSSGMWRRVVWTDVSEELIASIFKVEKSAGEEPAWAGGSRHRVHGDLDAVIALIYSCWNCGATNVAPTYVERPAPPSSKRRPHFETRTCLGGNKNLGHKTREEWSQERLCCRSQQQFIRPTVTKDYVECRQVRERRITEPSSCKTGCSTSTKLQLKVKKNCFGPKTGLDTTDWPSVIMWLRFCLELQSAVVDGQWESLSSQWR